MGVETGSRAAAAAIEALERLLARHRRLLRELRRYEELYGMTTREFIEAWRKGRIPEPEDPDMLAEFMSWETLYETLCRLEEQIERETRAAWRGRSSKG